MTIGEKILEKLDEMISLLKNMHGTIDFKEENEKKERVTVSQIIDEWLNGDSNEQ